MRIILNNYSGSSGLYAKAIPDYKSSKKLEQFIYKYRPPFAINWLPNKTHVSVMCSDVAVPKYQIYGMQLPDIETRILHAEYWTGVNGKGFVVFRVWGRPFCKLHCAFVSAGAKHRYPDYVPHVTVGLEVGPLNQDICTWIRLINAELASANTLIVFNRVGVMDLKF